MLMDRSKDPSQCVSSQWILESIINPEDMEEMVDVIIDSPVCSKPKSPKTKSFNKNRSNVKKINGTQNKAPRMGRTYSGASRGLQSLRFLDRTTTGKEGDAWKAVEKRFNQLAINRGLSRDDFGFCIGEFLLSLFLQINQSMKANKPFFFKAWVTPRSLLASSSIP